MIRLPCPYCSKDSWRDSVEDYSSCPYCGQVYSGKYGSLPLGEKKPKESKQIRPDYLQTVATLRG